MNMKLPLKHSLLLILSLAMAGCASPQTNGTRPHIAAPDFIILIVSNDPWPEFHRSHTEMTFNRG
jgi:type IV pilus biogenesis protein CpaD/CtpE